MTSSDAPNDFHSLTQEVVKSFLHTVVVLDDRAEMSPDGGDLAGRGVPGPLKPPDYSPSPAPTSSETSRDPRGAPLNAGAVIDGFAEIGSVCAVLKADQGGEFQERTVTAARRADIVILDWTLHDSRGEEALAILRKILSADPERLRLIAIYTGDPELAAIYERVREEIRGVYPNKEPKEEDRSLRLTWGPLHVVILAKSGTNVLPQFENQKVAEDGLADRLVTEFAEMTGGLIRNVAIQGIAGIRANAHKILAKFDPSLDPAYLGHRVLLPHPPEAEDHIEEALGSEIASVLEEHRPGKWADINAIKLWLAHHKPEGLRISDPRGPQDDAMEECCQLLVQGFEALGAPVPGFTNEVGKNTLRKRPTKATEPFAEDIESALRADHRFAALLQLKTRYRGRPPRLSIGTVLLDTSEGAQDSYLLCLQPKCDSVRLRGQTGFPFIPLVPLMDEGGGNEGLRLVVEIESDQWEYFGIKPKPSELLVPVFQPGDDTLGEVTAEKVQGDQFVFEDVDKRRYRWIAQVKDEHALRVAGEVAAAMARPGPNDAEWLRRGKYPRR